MPQEKKRFFFLVTGKRFSLSDSEKAYVNYQKQYTSICF